MKTKKKIINNNIKNSKKNYIKYGGAANDTQPLVTNLSQKSNIITIDVGGKIFRTNKDILIENSGYFERLFSEDWDKEGNNILFLDIDPIGFKYTLSIIRNQDFHVPDMYTYKNVLKVADYLDVKLILDDTRPVEDIIDNYKYFKMIEKNILIIQDYIAYAHSMGHLGPTLRAQAETRCTLK